MAAREERTALCVTVRREHRVRLAEAARRNERSVAAEVGVALDKHFGLVRDAEAASQVRPDVSDDLTRLLPREP